MANTRRRGGKEREAETWKRMTGGGSERRWGSIPSSPESRWEENRREQTDDSGKRREEVYWQG